MTKNTTIASTNSTTTKQKSDKQDNVGIAISVVCFVLLMVIVCVVIALMKHYNKKKAKDAAKMIRQQSTGSVLGAINNAYALGQEEVVMELPDENQRNAVIAVNDEDRSRKKRRPHRKDHTLDSFLFNVESGISDKQLANNISKARSKSALLQDPTKDQILCGFLKSFENSEMRIPQVKEESVEIADPNKV